MNRRPKQPAAPNGGITSRSENEHHSMAEAQWYSVRSVFRLDKVEGDRPITLFEERVFLPQEMNSAIENRDVSDSCGRPGVSGGGPRAWARMRIIASLTTLLGLATLALGKSSLCYSNNVTRAEAVRIASQLSLGMWEEHASKLLATNGLECGIGVGSVSGWDRCYGLSDGTSLHLDYRAREIARDGRWGGNGELRRAFIQSNGVNILFITRTNTPLRAVRP